ncbi:helix-turn-helix domain-containing protein [Camelimonas sp. ID_303_24]
MRRAECAKLHLPSRPLLACIYMAVERDTRAVQLTDADRFSYYPATPFPSISWILDGQLQMVEGGAGADAPRLAKPLPKVVFSGPTRKPSASWSPASVHALTVSFYPEALARLLRISIQQYVGTILPLERVLSPGKMDQLLTMNFGDGTDPYDRVQQTLMCLLKDVPAPRISDVRSWLALLATRTSSMTGMAGPRRKQRLVKDWTGQSLRDLQLYARVENAMSYGAEMSDKKGLNLAAVAAETGFSDQSHLGRDVRRVTGLPPAKLNELIQRDEAFWIYRLLR